MSSQILLWGAFAVPVVSIPAIFAITLDPFIVLTSNVFAIMGLRALYFLLAGVLGMFIYLKYGISFILGFVGIKMILIMLGIHLPIAVSLGIIVVSLIAAIGLSLFANTAPELGPKAGLTDEA